jgi:hypothetical protein
MPSRKKPRSTSSYLSRTPQHRALRARLKREFDAAGYLICARADCPYPDHLITHGQAWDLGHVDGDPTRYSGPEHRSCNRRTMTPARQRAAAAAPKLPAAPAMRDMTTPLADIPEEDRVRLGRWSRQW